MEGMKLHPEIAIQLALVDTAKESLKAMQEAVQKNCPHAFVAEKPYSNGIPATRICLACRLEEMGSHWSGGATWSRHGFKEESLGNADGRLVLTPEQAGVSHNFWSLRLPYLGPITEK